MSYDKTVVVPLPIDETFALITQPDRLRRWNSIAARIDLRAGGDYRWTIVPGNTAAGTITELEPGKRVVLGWGWEGSTEVPPDASTVTITVEPTDDGTKVRLVHDGLSEQQEQSHAEGWDHYLDRLVLAGAAGDAGLDSWTVPMADLDELKSAEATLGIVEHVLRQISAAEVDNSTPCTEFTVAQLVEHLSGSIAAIGGAAGAELSPTSSGVVEVDIADLAQPALEAWAGRGLEGTVSIGGMELPATFALGILSVEFLVHAWDFATATGQKLVVDDDLTTYVLGLSKRVVSEQMRVPGMFGAEVEVGPDAGALERLVAFTGRPIS
jgi:uncharacterized protein (TIGR03086 family)